MRSANHREIEQDVLWATVQTARMAEETLMPESSNCLHCRWLRYNHNGNTWWHACGLGKRLPMHWCSEYEREPGSDDDLTET